MLFNCMWVLLYIYIKLKLPACCDVSLPQVTEPCKMRTPSYFIITLMNSGRTVNTTTIPHDHRSGSQFATTIELPQNVDTCGLFVYISAGNGAGMSLPAEIEVGRSHHMMAKLSCVRKIFFLFFCVFCFFYSKYRMSHCQHFYHWCWSSSNWSLRQYSHQKHSYYHHWNQCNLISQRQWSLRRKGFQNNRWDLYHCKKISMMGTYALASFLGWPLADFIFQPWRWSCKIKSGSSWEQG